MTDNKSDANIEKLIADVKENWNRFDKTLKQTVINLAKERKKIMRKEKIKKLFE